MPWGRRRETEATRKKRARIAKERQGPDGKWETNERKAAVRKARAHSKKIGGIFGRSLAKKAAADASALKEAQELVAALEAVASADGIRGLMPRLERLPATAAIFVKTRIPVVTTAALKRFPDAKRVVAPLLVRWRSAYRQDVQKAKEAASSPCATAQAAKKSAAAESASATSATTPVRNAGASAHVAGTPTPVTRKRKGSGEPSDSTSSSSSDSDSSSSSKPVVVQQVPAETPAGRKRPKILKQKRISAFFAPQGGS
eukprot:gnl/TRDRNA2_/TRDRNA2_85283_c0_seq1.p1 gnl/TRDRNA2_/TRDRNA2_85283_c0~~gnl/TRDRNA2_/TRDRNA2_85283_c0_seq1.p1  ORF type:complete len:258 (+),score=50.39 gnl/TRDRNA2_/TRDRNA2_85283_c0_seq1:72-845(+)